MKNKAVELPYLLCLLLVVLQPSVVFGFVVVVPNQRHYHHHHHHHTALAAKSKPGANKVTTDSGLVYEEIEIGDGKVPGSSDFVSVHYEGRLSNGKVFDSSRRDDDGRSEINKGLPLEFALGRGKVIRGWEEGVASMKVGGKRRLFIPADLAYGAAGTPDGVIKPNTNVVFDVELMSVNGNMSLAGSMGKGFQFALSMIAVNGVTLYVTGNELREYFNGSVPWPWAA